MEIIIVDKRTAPNKEYHPYDVAYKKSFTVHESGTFANEITKQIFLGDGWYDKGKNHIVDVMKFSRDVDCTEMCINVNSIEELFEYLREQDGDIRCRNYQYGNNIPAIYIYDWV